MAGVEPVQVSLVIGVSTKNGNSHNFVDLGQFTILDWYSWPAHDSSLPERHCFWFSEADLLTHEDFHKTTLTFRPPRWL